jgi:hypothetical protein
MGASTDTALRDLLAARVREDVRLRLGPNAQALAAAGEPVMLSGGEADGIAEAALAALRDAGYTITPPPTRPAKRLRRPGSPWRLLAHEWLGPRPGGPHYGLSYHVSNNPPDYPPGDWRRDHILEGSEFDELVVSKWLHLEQMDTGSWWMVAGGVTINIRVDRDGRTKAVLVEGPNDNHGPVEGAKYRLVWNGREETFVGEPGEEPNT